MKRLILPLLAAVALLVGCTGQNELSSPAPSGSPSGTPAPVSSSAPSPTPSAESEDEGLVWGKNFGLEDIDLKNLPEKTALAADLWTEQLALVGTVPDADVSLYALSLARPGVLLRQGDDFEYFPLDRQFQDLPLLVWQDFDGDGAEELAVRYLMAEGDDAVSAINRKYGLDDGEVWPRFELHVYDREDDVWSDASFGSHLQDLRSMLGPNLSYTVEDHTFTILAGRADSPAGEFWLASVTGWVPDADVAEEGPLVVGSQIFFRLEKSGITTVITLSLPSTAGGAPIDIATLTVGLEYADGQLSLIPNFQLEAVGNV